METCWDTQQGDIKFCVKDMHSFYSNINAMNRNSLMFVQAELDKDQVWAQMSDEMKKGALRSLVMADYMSDLNFEDPDDLEGDDSDGADAGYEDLDDQECDVPDDADTGYGGADNLKCPLSSDGAESGNWKNRRKGEESDDSHYYNSVGSPDEAQQRYGNRKMPPPLPRRLSDREKPRPTSEFNKEESGSASDLSWEIPRPTLDFNREKSRPTSDLDICMLRGTVPRIPNGIPHRHVLHIRSGGVLTIPAKATPSGD